MKDEPGRGADNAKLFILNSLHEHLEQTSTYVRLFCVDFSSAFNTMQPHILIKKTQILFPFKSSTHQIDYQFSH